MRCEWVLPMFAVRFASILHVVDMFHLKKEVFIQLDKANLAAGDVKFSPEGLPDLVTTVWSVYPREPGVRTHPSSLSAFSPMNNCYRQKCELSIDYATCIMYVCLCVCGDLFVMTFTTCCTGLKFLMSRSLPTPTLLEDSMNVYVDANRIGKCS